MFKLKFIVYTQIYCINSNLLYKLKFIVKTQIYSRNSNCTLYFCLFKYVSKRSYCNLNVQIKESDCEWELCKLILSLKTSLTGQILYLYLYADLMSRTNLCQEIISPLYPNHLQTITISADQSIKQLIN